MKNKKEGKEKLQVRKDKRRFNQILRSSQPTGVKRARISQGLKPSKRPRKIKYTCPKCHIDYRGGNYKPAWVACDSCDTWYHLNCADKSQRTL